MKDTQFGVPTRFMIWQKHKLHVIWEILENISFKVGIQLRSIIHG